MKYLKTYEQVDLNRFHNYKEYRELADTLEGEIFDEYNIVYVEDEGDVENDYPIAYEKGKCWCYSYTRLKFIISIDILNLTIEETDKILKELEDIKDMVYGRSEIRYKVTSGEYSSGREEDENPMEDYRALSSQEINEQPATDLRYISIAIIDGLYKSGRINVNESILGEIWSSGQVDKVFTPLVNWELIADAKDLSLDYLDNGCWLSIYIKYKFDNRADSVIYTESFSHDNSIKCWQPCYILNVDKRNLVYYFKLYHLNRSNNFGKFDDEIGEIISILKEMHPDENITRT